MRRRCCVIGLIACLVAAPLTGWAEAERPHSIGLLSPEDEFPGLEVIRSALRDLGHVEGQNLIFVARNPEGRRLPWLAEELVRLKVDVIVAVNTPAVQVAKNATSHIPIVMMRVADPVSTGLVASLARPGGNVTGLSFIPDALSGKRLQLLKEMLPQADRVAALWYADNPGATAIVREREVASPQIRIELLSLAIDRGTNLADRLAAAAAAGARALIIVDDAFITKRKEEVLDLAARHHLPVFAMWKEFAEAGALVSYGPSSIMYRRVADYIAKILQGVRPANLPVEQPTTFDLFINLRTAKGLGLTVPATLLARADEVIE